MAIPERFLDDLMARFDIVDVVSDYVTLNKKGGNYWGLCPFHGEKTPSFSVSPDKQIYHCFGCGKGGGTISFVMEMENLPFVEAVRLLAKRAGLEMPETQQDDGYRRRREKLLLINKEAARFFHQQLSTPRGATGLDYLNHRGLSRGTITRFGLGCAPDGWDNLISAMAEKGYDKGELLDAGLAVKSQNGRIYDRFRNRVMFPIIDLHGAVIGFGGRVLDDSTPKYLNSPDTAVFNKSRNLFGLNLARKTSQTRIILTEGYMDTIALHQAGFDCAVASLGTAFTPDHAQLLARYTKEAIIAYDSDGAGVSAAQRAIPILERTGLKVRILRMVGAKDPDEFIKKNGKDAFGRLLDQSENHMEYRLGRIEDKFHLEDDVEKIEYVRECAALIASLHSSVEREIYGGRCAQKAGISAEAMAQEVKRALSQRLRREQKKQERRDLTPVAQLQPKARELHYDNVRSARAEEGVLRLVLLDPILFQNVGQLQSADFSSPFLGKIFNMLQQRWQAGLSVQLSALAGELTGDEMGLLTSLMQEPQALHASQTAMADYINTIDTEKLKRSGDTPEALLLAAREKYKEKKGYGGQTNERN